MKKLILSVFVSMLVTGSYAQNQVGFGPDLGLGKNRQRAQNVPQPQVMKTPDYIMPPMVISDPLLNKGGQNGVQNPVNNYDGTEINNSGFENNSQEDTHYKPIYKNDIVSVANKVEKNNEDETIMPEKSEAVLFKECMIRSSKMLDVLDILKKIPEKDRISTLYKSGYWAELSESEKNQTLQTIANMSGVDEENYLVIKGKMARSFENECFQIIKHK